jgi:glycosyltransferase involved in cell wall biosynthesis
LDEWAAQIQSMRPDILVTNGIKPHVIGAIALRKFPGLPLVVTARGLRRTPAVACDLPAVSGALRRRRRHFGMSRDATTYLPPAVRPEVIGNIVNVPVERECHDEPIEKPEGELWFATIGALTPLKGHDVFLKAAAVVSRERPEARFLIVGSNQYAPEQGMDYAGQLRALASRLQLDPVVQFLGQRRDVPRLLRQIDVVVQCNTAPEAFGRSVAEGMSGLPVIASWAELFDRSRTADRLARDAARRRAPADRMLTGAIDPA